MTGNQETAGKTKAEKADLGTFAGVFTPSILTILGIILFLRLGYVVGNAGVGRALMLIGIANAISVLTTFSLSAIATNLRVKGGGDYYLISRTLGVEFGGAIGIVLFLAQSVSVAFYCMGFSEALAGMLSYPAQVPIRVVAVLAVSFLFVFAWLGADWATWFQYVVMALLAAALVSFFTGGLPAWSRGVFVANWAVPSVGPPFWTLFAVFFPAVTGFTQGVSMSGDLKDPGRSLPRGTFLAVGISIVVYFATALVFGGTLPNEELAEDYAAMKRVAAWGPLIDAGVIGATLSSAMASFLGAPRILQSLAADRVFPFLHPFAKGHGAAGNPRRAVLVCACIALGTIGLGSLNLIARVVSMFFLISYGLLNYATFYEARTLSPSFRPRFHWYDFRLSLLGGLACLGVMLAIDVAAGLVAVSVLFAIFQYLRRTVGPARWADSRRSYHLQRVRDHLVAAAAEPMHPRDWRPQILAFSNHPERRAPLLRFASWIQGGSGLVTAVRILEGRGLKMLKLRSDAEAELRRDIAQGGLDAFALVVFAADLQIGVHSLVQCFGIGPLRANTLLLNWLEGLPEGILGLREMRYGLNLREAFRLGCNIVILDAKEKEWNALEALSPERRRIDLWWWEDAGGRLMLLLAYLMTRSASWAEAAIRILVPVSQQEREEKTGRFQALLEEVRIEARLEMVADVDARSVTAWSADAALVFLPFRLRGHLLVDPFGDRLEGILQGLPLVAMVLAAEDIDLDAEPEEGRAGESAAALDALVEARKNAHRAEEQAAQAAQEGREKLRELLEAVQSLGEEGTLRELDIAVLKAQEQANRAARKAAKAQARVEFALRAVDALGAKDPKEAETGKGPEAPGELKGPLFPGDEEQ